MVELLLVSTNVLVRWGLRGNQMKLWSLLQCENPGLSKVLLLSLEVVRIELCVFRHVIGQSKVPSFKPGGGQNRALCVSLCNR